MRHCIFMVGNSAVKWEAYVGLARLRFCFVDSLPLINKLSYFVFMIESYFPNPLESFWSFSSPDQNFLLYGFSSTNKLSYFVFMIENYFLNPLESFWSFSSLDQNFFNCYLKYVAHMSHSEMPYLFYHFCFWTSPFGGK